MAQSLNSSVEYTDVASSYNGLPTHGNVMVGNRAFEYYNERNTNDFIQIPWDEVDYVSAEVIGKKSIARFAIFTKDNGHYTFATKDNKACLRAVREHVGEERMLRSPNFVEVASAGAKSIPKLVGGLFRKGE